MRDTLTRPPGAGCGPAPALARIPGLRRAWPEADGAVVFEAVDADGLLRAGRVDRAGTRRLTPYAADPDLPGLSPALAADLGGRLVVHRLGRRAVVVGERLVRKLVRPGRADRLCPPRARRAFGGAGLRVPEVVGRGSNHVDLELVPGRPLHELGDAGLAGWRRLARVWPDVVRGADARAALPEHTGAHEAAVLHRWLVRVRAAGALDALDAAAGGRGRIERGVERACAALGEDPRPAVAAHRDLHDGQFLWDGRELSLIDLDTAAAAEAALDLGNLAAHADLARMTGRLGAAAHDRVLGLLDDVAARLPTASRRLRAYTDAARLRLALVHVFRPGAGAWLAAWTHLALNSTTTLGWRAE